MLANTEWLSVAVDRLPNIQSGFSVIHNSRDTQGAVEWFGYVMCGSHSENVSYLV